MLRKRLGNLDDALDLHPESFGIGQTISDRHGLASNLAAWPRWPWLRAKLI